MSKTYSKKEISQILSKASEIQTELDFHLDQGELTESELTEIAKELGISTKALELAKKTPLLLNSDFTFNWLIGSSELQKTIFIPQEISKEEIISTAADLNALAGKKGSLETLGRAFDWEQKEFKLESLRRITFNPDQGSTKITHYVNWNEFRYLGLGLSTFLCGLFLTVVLKSLDFSKPVYFLMSFAGALVGYSGFMVVLNSYFKKQKKTI